MQPPSDAEIQKVSEMLRSATINSRPALLITLLGTATGSCQMGVLAARLGLSIPRVSMLGDTMVKDGLVDRCVPMADLRKTSLVLRAQGRDTAAGHLAMLRGFSACAVAATQPPHASKHAE